MQLPNRLGLHLHFLYNRSVFIIRIANTKNLHLTSVENVTILRSKRKQFYYHWIDGITKSKPIIIWATEQKKKLHKSNSDSSNVCTMLQRIRSPESGQIAFKQQNSTYQTEI